MILQGKIPLGERVSSIGDVPPDDEPSAIFDVPASSGDTKYVFLPSTILDTQLARNQRKDDAIFWIVKLDGDKDSETGFRVIRGTGQMCRGCFQVAENEKPNMLIFS